jgi:uncharacterized protein (TIGR00290 family)
MPQLEPVLFSWSGGKDSALALYEVLHCRRYEVVALLTTVAGQYGRVSHHGVREELLDLQAAALELPLDKLYLPVMDGSPCTNDQFEELMGNCLTRYRDEGVRKVVHGDLFLADLRAYRERNLARLGMEGVFPIWHRDTTELVHDFSRLGFKAVVCCVDNRLDGRFVGRELGPELISEFPPGIDPCGENGEYHSFVYDGPIFREPLEIDRGEIVLRDGRHYIDLLPRGRVAPTAVAQSIPPV